LDSPHPTVSQHKVSKKVDKAPMHRNASAAASALARGFTSAEHNDMKYSAAWEAQRGHPDAFTKAVASGALDALARVQADAIQVCTSLTIPYHTSTPAHHAQVVADTLAARLAADAVKAVPAPVVTAQPSKRKRSSR